MLTATYNQHTEYIGRYSEEVWMQAIKQACGHQQAVIE